MATGLDDYVIDGSRQSELRAVFPNPEHTWLLELDAEADTMPDARNWNDCKDRHASKEEGNRRGDECRWAARNSGSAAGVLAGRGS
jgi:hypothetical protein